LTRHVALGITQTVIFDDVVVNNGHAYNKHTGHFTAPREYACPLFTTTSSKMTV
jgi:hypothetical protein